MQRCAPKLPKLIETHLPRRPSLLYLSPLCFRDPQIRAVEPLLHASPSNTMSGIPGQREAPGDIDPATLSVDSPASSLTQDPYVKESPVSQADADSGVPPLHAYNVGTATQTPNSSASPAQLSFSAGSDTKSREQTVPSACLGCVSFQPPPAPGTPG